MKITVRRQDNEFESMLYINTVLVLLKAKATSSSKQHLSTKIQRLYDPTFVATLSTELSDGYSTKFRQKIEPVVTILRKNNWNIPKLVQYLREKWITETP